MHTVEVTREIYERCNDLAQMATVPELKERLRRLADSYRLELEKLANLQTGSIAPD